MKAAIVGLTLLLSVAAWAQPAPQLAWEHSGVEVQWFEIVVDDDTENPIDVGLPEPDGTTYAVAFPTLSVGTHRLVIRACNVTDCTAAPAITVVVLSVSDEDEP